MGDRPFEVAQSDCRTGFLDKHCRNGCNLFRAQTGVDLKSKEIWVTLLVASEDEIVGGLGEGLRGVYRRRGDW